MQKEIAKRKNTESEDAKSRLAVIEQDMQEIKRLLAELNSMRTVNGN
jgi:hypothetical protein